jgi:hypothetical protein
VLDRFAFSRANLTSEHQRKIDQLAAQIVASWKSNRPALHVEMVGYTDKHGDTDYNNDLGRRRGERVLKALSDAVWIRDVDVRERMTWGRTSEGERRPTSSNAALNRRVEVFIQRGRVVSAPSPACPYDTKNAFAVEREAARRILALSTQVANRTDSSEVLEWLVPVAASFPR